MGFYSLGAPLSKKNGCSPLELNHNPVLVTAVERGCPILITSNSPGLNLQGQKSIYSTDIHSFLQGCQQMKEKMLGQCLKGLK